MSVLGTALHKTFHFLRQRRHVPRAGNERRVPGARSCPSGAGEGLLSGSWQWGKLSNELPLKLCKRHSPCRSQWCCLCTSLTPLVHRLLTFPRLLTRQGRGGNMTGLVQPSQIKVAALQVEEKITEEKGRINEPNLS